jgi:hypothetical protein
VAYQKFEQIHDLPHERIVEGIAKTLYSGYARRKLQRVDNWVLLPQNERAFWRQLARQALAKRESYGENG